MLALVLEQPAPAAESPLLLREVPRPEPGPGEILLRVARLRRLPHRPADRRGRPGGETASDRARPPDRRPGRGPGPRRLGMVARRPLGCDVAGRRVRALPALSRGPREPLHRGDVHRLGSRRRLCRARHGAGGCGRAIARRDRRPRRRTAALRGRHRLPLAPRLRHRAGRQARPLRLRGLGALRDPGRRALGVQRLRVHALRARSSNAPSSSGRSGPAATTTRRPSRSMRRSRSRRPATSSSLRCAHSSAAARSPSTPSTSIACRSSPTTCSGGSAASAASRTSRAGMPASSSISPRASRCVPTSKCIP